MSDISQLNFTEPGQTDWDNYGKSGWTPPPPAKGPDGQYIVYTGVAKSIGIEEAYPEKDDNGQTYLTLQLNDLTIADPGKYQGYELKFTKAGRKPYTSVGPDGKRVPKKGNPSRLGDYLRSAGSQGKPQTNPEYLATAKQAAGRKFQFSIEWEAKDKDTGEQIKGYDAFPDDPINGGKKAILKEGDFYNELGADNKPTGNQKKVQAKTLFANARVRFFVTPKKGV